MEPKGPLRGTVSPTGYSLPAGLTYDEWAAEGPILIAMAQSAMWWVGDWLRYGEHRFGEKYAAAVEATGYAVQTLKNAQWVAERFPPGERRPDVPYSVHRAAATLDPEPRRQLLRTAAAEHLSEYEVREKVREIKGITAEPAPAAPVAPPRTLADAHRDALAALDRALAASDWAAVSEARAYVAEAGFVSIDLLTAT
jgi:hypothetical protein